MAPNSAESGIRRGPARAENFFTTGGPPLKRRRIFFGSAGRRFFGSPGAGAGGCDIVVLHALRRSVLALATFE